MSVREYGNVKVVVEGSDRLRWGAPATGCRLEGLWPDPAELAAISRVFSDKTPLLVVIPHDPPSVTLLAEQLDRTSPLWAVLGCTGSGAVVEGAVPLLDWAVPDVRLAAEKYSLAARSVADLMPACTLPPMMFQRLQGPASHVCLAQCTSVCRSLPDRILASAADYALWC
jgi:hypothetical protein